MIAGCLLRATKRIARFTQTSRWTRRRRGPATSRRRLRRQDVLGREQRAQWFALPKIGTAVVEVQRRRVVRRDHSAGHRSAVSGDFPCSDLDRHRGVCERGFRAFKLLEGQRVLDVDERHRGVARHEHGGSPSSALTAAVRRWRQLGKYFSAALIDCFLLLELLWGHFSTRVTAKDPFCGCWTTVEALHTLTELCWLFWRATCQQQNARFSAR